MDKKPYIVCCICKNELQYIKEFVNYHLDLGFNKIIIGDNNDNNGESYDEILKEEIDNNEVEIINIRGLNGVQKSFYNQIIHNYDYEWCAFIDCDEFITFSDNSKFDNIKDFLDSRKDINAYALNWMVYGDNGRVLKGQGDVIDRFPKPQPLDFKFHYPFPENYHVKSILRKDAQGDFTTNPHIACPNTYYQPSGEKIATSPFNQNMDYSVLYIKHFYTKSLEEWVNKKMKNKYADSNPSEHITYYPIDDFFIYNKITEQKKKYLKQNGIEFEGK